MPVHPLGGSSEFMQRRGVSRAYEWNRLQAAPTAPYAFHASGDSKHAPCHLWHRNLVASSGRQRFISRQSTYQSRRPGIITIIAVGSVPETSVLLLCRFDNCCLLDANRQGDLRHGRGGTSISELQLSRKHWQFEHERTGFGSQPLQIPSTADMDWSE
jgi:hypothetical protein